MRRSWLVVAGLVLGCVTDGPTGTRGAPPLQRSTVLAEAGPEPVSVTPAPVQPRIRDASCRTDPSACVRKGVALTRTDLPRAASLFESACALGSLDGCGNFAVMLVDGRGVGEDRVSGQSLLRRTCDGGHQRSCQNLRGLR